MAKKKLAEPAHFQLVYEEALRIGVWILGTFHMLLSAFRYTVRYKLFQPYEQWFGVALLISAIAYLLITALKYPQTTYRLKHFFTSMKNYEMFFMMGLLCWFVIVCAVRQKTDQINYFKFGDWWLYDSAVLAMILFPFSRYFGKENEKRVLQASLHLVVLSYSVFTGWALWHVFHLNIITLPSGSQIGMTANKELSLGCYYNISGAIACTVFAIALYMIVTQRTAFKIVYGIAAALQLCAALMSNSRTVFITLLFIAASAAFLTGCWIMRHKMVLIKMIVSLGMAAICCAILWYLRTAVFTWFEAATHFSELLSGGTVGAEEAAAESVRELNNLSGREEIWKDAIKVMFSSPIAFCFGVTPFSVTEALQQIGGLHFEAAHAHNVILQFGASFGVPAMIAFVIFLIRICIKCVRAVLDFSSPNYGHRMMIAITVGSLILMNLTEAYLVAYFSIMSCVFFLFCGFLERK